MPPRFCIHYVNKSGRPQDWKRSILIPVPKKGSKNGLTIGQPHSSPILVRWCLKSCMLSFSIMWIKNFQMSKLGLEKKEEPEIKLPIFAGSQRKLGNSSKTSTSVSLTIAVFDCVDHNKLWKALTEMGTPDHLTCLLRNTPWPANISVCPLRLILHLLALGNL